MTRQTPLWLQAGTYPAALDRQLISAMFPFVGASGCAVSAASGMTVNIAAGKLAVPVTGAGSVLCVSDATEQATLAAAPASGSNRIDLVIAQVRATDLDSGANNDFLFSTVTGTAAASPVAPAVPANAIALASVYVPGASASVVAGNITDRRLPLLPWGLPWGRLASVISTADFSTQNNVETTVLDLGNFNFRANRIYEVRLSFNATIPTGCRGMARIYNVTDAARVSVVDHTVAAASSWNNSRFSGFYPLQLTADAVKNFRFTAQNANNVGTFTIFGGDPFRQVLAVHDVGPATPTPAG